MSSDHDYPTDEDLKKIREWDCTDDTGEKRKALLEFVRSIWWAPDWGIHVDENGVWHVSTGGWSGNEEIIEAMGTNFLFWSLAWFTHRRGGHYTFIPLVADQDKGRDQT